MKRKIVLFLYLIVTCSCLTACNNDHDTIEVYNKDIMNFDNIKINIKDDYFYDSHERFTIDDNTVAVTLYFKNSEIDDWNSK